MELLQGMLILLIGPFLVFGLICNHLARKYHAMKPGFWFWAGFFLGPLGMALVLVAINQKNE